MAWFHVKFPTATVRLTEPMTQWRAQQRPPAHPVAGFSRKARGKPKSQLARHDQTKQTKAER